MASKHLILLLLTLLYVYFSRKVNWIFNGRRRMTDAERITNLENRIAQLEARIAQLELSRIANQPTTWPAQPPYVYPMTPPWTITC